MKKSYGFLFYVIVDMKWFITKNFLFIQGRKGLSRYKFKIIKKALDVEQKRARALEYNEFDATQDEEIDVEEFIKKEIYEDYIHFKCLKCDYEEIVEADIILECFNSRMEDYPVSYCPNCNKPKLVPIDVYEQIKAKK